MWPGTVLYAAFVWVELVFYGSSVPLSIAFLVLSYSVITWIGMAVFGKDAWLRGVRLSRSSSGSLLVLRLPRCG